MYVYGKLQTNSEKYTPIELLFLLELRGHNINYWIRIEHITEVCVHVTSDSM